MNSQAAGSTPSADAASISAFPRLPCRGCLPGCTGYATCGGAPWRVKNVNADTRLRAARGR